MKMIKYAVYNRLYANDTTAVILEETLNTLRIQSQKSRKNWISGLDLK